MTQQHTFADVLSRAIASSGLSLVDITNELNKQGFSLSAASLSYWKTGKSLPTRKSSLPILEAIEKLCSLKPGALIAAAQIDSQTNRQRRTSIPSRTTRAPDNKRTQIPKGSEELESGINWEYEAERKIIIDSYRFSSDLTQVQQETTILARITNPSHSHLHVGIYVGDNEEVLNEDEIGLNYLEGAPIGDTIRHENNKLVNVRLDLPESCKVGDLHRIFYQLVPYHFPSPAIEAPSRHFAWSLSVYSCNVFFEGIVPKNIEWVTETTQEYNGPRLKQTTAQRVKPNGNTVQFSMENVQGILGYFRWTL